MPVVYVNVEADYRYLQVHTSMDSAKEYWPTGAVFIHESNGYAVYRYGMVIGRILAEVPH